MIQMNLYARQKKETDGASDRMTTILNAFNGSNLTISVQFVFFKGARAMQY